MSTDTISTSSDCRLSSTAVVASVASVLSEMCAINDQAREQHPSLAAVTRFHSIAKAPISIHDYLARIRSFSACSNSCFVIALMFLDKAQRRSGLAVDSLSVHRLMVTSIMLATKVYDDRVQRNKAYAVIGGLSTAELNRLEIELLNSLGFELEISPDDFAGYEVALMRRLNAPSSPSSTNSALSAISADSSSPDGPLSPRSTPPSTSVPFSPRSTTSVSSPLSPRSRVSSQAVTSPRRSVSFSMPVKSPSGYPPFLSPRTPHTPLPIARRQSSFSHAAAAASASRSSSDESEISSSSRSVYPAASDSDIRSPRRGLQPRTQAVLVN